MEIRVGNDTLFLDVLTCTLDFVIALALIFIALALPAFFWCRNRIYKFTDGNRSGALATGITSAKKLDCWPQTLTFDRQTASLYSNSSPAN